MVQCSHTLCIRYVSICCCYVNTSHAWLLAQNGSVSTHWAPNTTRFQTPVFEWGSSELWVCYEVDCLETNKKHAHRDSLCASLEAFVLVPNYCEGTWRRRLFILVPSGYPNRASKPGTKCAHGLKSPKFRIMNYCWFSFQSHGIFKRESHGS